MLPRLPLWRRIAVLGGVAMLLTTAAFALLTEKTMVVSPWGTFFVCVSFSLVAWVEARREDDHLQTVALIAIVKSAAKASAERADDPLSVAFHKGALFAAEHLSRTTTPTRGPGCGSEP